MFPMQFSECFCQLQVFGDLFDNFDSWCEFFVSSLQVVAVAIVKRQVVTGKRRLQIHFPPTKTFPPNSHVATLNFPNFAGRKKKAWQQRQKQQM